MRTARESERSVVRVGRLQASVERVLANSPVRLAGVYVDMYKQLS